jgi:hypothetical protein
MPVVGYENYEVSDHARVRSIGRDEYVEGGKRKAYTRWRPEQLLAICFNRGYPQVTLWRDGQSRSFFIHVLVMRAFVGPCPAGEVVCHNDGNTHNSRLDNLRYDSPKGNAIDAVRHGRIRRGEDNHRARLCEADVRAIIELAKTGLPDNQIAERFGVTTAAIFAIRRGRAWRHIAGRGLGRRGYRRPTIIRSAKLTEETARAIRAALVAGESVRSVAERYSVSKTTIYRTASGEQWLHAGGEAPKLKQRRPRNSPAPLAAATVPST